MNENQDFVPKEVPANKNVESSELWVGNEQFNDSVETKATEVDTRVPIIDEASVSQQQDIIESVHSRTAPEDGQAVESVGYFDPRLSLEDRVAIAMDDLQIPADKRESIQTFLNLLREKHQGSYEHSLRVGLVGRRIARFMRLDEKALLYSGLLHDVGKIMVPKSTLVKTEGWTAEDSINVQGHVEDGYKLLRDKFDFTAEVVLLHHRFQTRQYPQELPEFLHSYGEGTKTLIKEYGRILALADVYDALHRINDHHGTKRALSGKEIKEQMLALNPDRQDLIEQLYSAGILTTYEVGESRPEEPDQDLYDQGWEDEPLTRTAAEIQRHVQIATAIEPISDKPGCTTRYEDVSRHLKVEDFIIAGINIGEAFAKLTQRIIDKNQQPEVIYDIALEAQRKNVRNRRGGRINQGIIEELVPIVAAHALYDQERKLTVEQILGKAQEIMRSTGRQDVDQLRAMKEHAHKLVHYDKEVHEHPEAENVYQYYEQDLVASEGKPTGQAHNREFVEGFPTVKIIYDTLCASPLPNLNARIEDAFLMARKKLGPAVGPGFLADCVASALYLYLAHHPNERLL